MQEPAATRSRAPAALGTGAAARGRDRARKRQTSAASPQEEPRYLSVPAASSPPLRPRPSLGRAVALRTEAKSYRGDPWDVQSHLADLLRDAGLSVTGDAGASAEPDATLAVRYEETKGAAYRDFNIIGGRSEGNGTKLMLTVALSGKDKKPIAQWTILSGTPRLARGGSLYDLAIQSLATDSLFPALGDLVAARLSAPEATHEIVARLLPLVISSGARDGFDTLEAVRFKPATPREEVYVALAEDDAKSYLPGLPLMKLGEPAVDTLVEAIRARKGPCDPGSDSENPWPDKIAPVLGKIGDPRAEAALVAKLGSCARGNVVKALRTTGAGSR